MRVDRMADTVGEQQISHRSRPLVRGRNLAPINGCRSSECGREQESRHDFRDRWRGALKTGVISKKAFGTDGGHWTP